MNILEQTTIDTQATINHLLLKQVDDFVSAEIIDVLTSGEPVQWESFSSHDVRSLYEKREHLMRDLMKIRKTLGHEQFLSKMHKIESMYPSYRDILLAEHREIIAKYGYEIDDAVKQSYLHALGGNIQMGGANAQGVFLITGTDLVAIVKGEGSYVHELPQRTLINNISLPTVPKVVDVFIHEGKTYKIMKKAPGTQLDRLTPEQIAAIPQKHYDQFLSDTNIIESAGLKIDPSKSSNFFYDENIGFCFIDLGVREPGSTWSMFDYIGNFNAHSYLDAAKLQLAWDRK